MAKRRASRDHIRRPKQMPVDIIQTVLFPHGTGRADICRWSEMWVITCNGEPCWIRWGVRGWSKHFRKCWGIYLSERQAAAKAKALNIEYETSEYGYRRIV